MVIVYVWNYRGKNDALGHASLQVDLTYISWWPEPSDSDQSKIQSVFHSHHPFRNRTFRQDVRDENQPPDHTIHIDGLNESAIKDWWQSHGLIRDGVELQGPLQPWCLLSRNCSQVVATALRIGGGDKYASWIKSWNFVWAPADVVAYARSIQDGLMRFKR